MLCLVDVRSSLSLLWAPTAELILIAQLSRGEEEAPPAHHKLTRQRLEDQPPKDAVAVEGLLLARHELLVDLKGEVLGEALTSPRDDEPDPLSLRELTEVGAQRGAVAALIKDRAQV